MAKTVKISDALFELARSEAATMHRSVPSQLEYWCKIASRIEQLGLPQTTLAEIAKAEPTELGQVSGAARVYELLMERFRAPNANALGAFRRKLENTGLPMYEHDPSGEGMVVAVHPDGRRERGRITASGFEPARSKARKAAAARR
jgi:hypothetical protein